MCGIVGYVGEKNCVGILLDGLKRLEYRGYDSAGMAVIDGDRIETLKSSGKVADLAEKICARWGVKKDFAPRTGISHTRWATHGAPTEANAHPHVGESGRFAIVHNGIIENYASIKSHLEQKGHKFASETDSEVIVHLIEECFQGDLFQAVAAAVKQLVGTFGICVVSLEAPDTIVTARRGSPIVIGVGDNESIVASDISAIISHTKRVIYLNDNDIALVKKEGVEIRSIDNVPVKREISKIDWDADAVEKNGFDHYMLKEIFEQPDVIYNAVRGHINESDATSTLSGLNLTPMQMAMIDRIVIAACGTSLNAGMVGEYYFEDLADLPTSVEQAAEFRYRNPIIEPRTLVIPISQSGETADTLAAVREAVNKGAFVASICNVVGSTIARETGRGVYLHAGPEIGVASSKAFTSQLTVLLLMALKFGRGRRLSREDGEKLIDDLRKMPTLVKTVLESAPHIEKIAKKYAGATNMFYIGRGYLYPIALEGALKIKEISYIHAEGYHAAELKHGPIALLDEKVPVVALANRIPGYDKIIGNIQECKARKSPVIVTATVGDTDMEKLADDIIWIPPCSKFVAPVATIVALQLLAYHVAKIRGCSIDQPKNLAKSVTVE